MESIKGKNALITGGGKGLGRALAIALAQEGVNVGLVARSEGDLIKVADELKQYNITTAIAPGDVSDMESINVAVQKIRAELGPIDILINNAGISTFGSFLELEPSRWEDIIKVNLLGVYYTTRTVFQEMMDRKVGDIINVSSTSGLKGGPVSSAYSASKAAVIALSESLMQEGRKHNVRVTTMLPSTVATDMARNLNLTDGNPERVMQAEDFAELVVLQLKLNRRVFVKESQIWSTNP